MKVKLTTGEKLKDLRKEANLTSEELCKEIELKYNYIITKSKYNEIENDKDKDFGYKSFIYLAKYYDVSTDYLLGLSENPTTKEDLKAAIKYTGLSEEAIEGWTRNLLINFPSDKILFINGSPEEFDKRLTEPLGKLLVINEFYDFLLALRDLQNVSERFISTKTSERFDFDDKCDMIRYRVIKLIEKIINRFDIRER